VWKKISPMLEDKGHQVYPITLTGMGDRVHLASREFGIETVIQDVVNVIEYNDLQDFVLVGHSFAGKVAAAVADRVSDRVRALLYLDAYRPNKNVRTPQGSFIDEWQVDGWKVPFPKEILDVAGIDVQGADREWMQSKATPLPVKYFRESVTLSENFDHVKSAYILCTRGVDDVEEILKENLDGPVKVIESGHWPMITKPGELVDAILSLSSV
jgi:pimeloyl-ACP methyl ester carboxylesterase